VRSGPILIENNLFESGVEDVLGSQVAADNVTLAHNTYPGYGQVLGGRSMIFSHSAYSANNIIRDNIFPTTSTG